MGSVGTLKVDGNSVGTGPGAGGSVLPMIGTITAISAYVNGSYVSVFITYPSYGFGFISFDIFLDGSEDTSEKMAIKCHDAAIAKAEVTANFLVSRTGNTVYLQEVTANGNLSIGVGDSDCSPIPFEFSP